MIKIEGDLEDQSSTESPSVADQEKLILFIKSSVSDDGLALALETRPEVFMASSSMDPAHPSSTQDNHKGALQKAISASKGSKRLEDEKTGNNSSLGFHCLDYDSAHHSVKRIYWDLNAPTEEWDANASGKYGMENKSSRGVMHEQKTERCLQSDLTLGTSINEKSRFSLQWRNLELPADNERDYEGSLELQLRPPCRPELCIRWGNRSPPYLSLSLTSTLPEVSCSPVKPESSECSRGMETATDGYNISKSVGTGDVKSELCDGSVQVETSNEFEGNLANSELDNNRLMSCCTKSTPSKVIPVVPNEEATPAVDMLPDHHFTTSGDANITSDDGQRVAKEGTPAVDMHPDHHSTMPGDANITSDDGQRVAKEAAPAVDMLPDHHSTTGDANITSDDGQRVVKQESPVLTILLDDNSDRPCTSNIKSGEGTCPAMDPDTLSGSSRKAGDGISNVCTHQRSERSLSKSSDTAEPIISNSDICNTNGTEVPETDVTFAYPHIDTAETMAYDGMSEGSAEMDCSDNEYCSSQVLVAGNIQVDHGETSVPRVGSLMVNKQPQGAAEGPGGVQDKISIAQSGRVDAEDGRLGYPEPRCASEDSCEHEEEGIYGNVATYSIGLDDQPMTGFHRVTKDKQIVLEEVRSGLSADNVVTNVCLDKKETFCKTTMSSATRMQEASSRKGLTKPSQEALKKLPRKKGSEGKPTSIKPQSAIAASNETPAAIPPMKIRDADVSVNHPELSERGSNVNGVTIKHTHDEVRKSNQTKKVTSPSLRSPGRKDPISSRSVTTGSEQDKCDDPWRQRSSRQGKRHSKHYSRSNHDKQDSNYVNSRRARKLRFHMGPHYKAEFGNPRRYHVPRHHEEFEIPPDGSGGSAGGSSGQVMDDQLNHSSRFPPNRQLPGRPPEGPIYTSPNGRFIGREVHENLQLGHDEIMMTLPGEMVENLMYPHSSVHPPVIGVDGFRSPHFGRCFHQDIMVPGKGPPSYSQLPSDIRQIHPINDLELCQPGVLPEGNVGPVEYIGPAHYVEHFVDRRESRPFLTPRDAEQDILPYAAHSNVYRPNHFGTDGEAFPGRSSYRDFRNKSKGRWYEGGFKNFRRKRRRC